MPTQEVVVTPQAFPTDAQVGTAVIIEITDMSILDRRPQQHIINDLPLLRMRCMIAIFQSQ